MKTSKLDTACLPPHLDERVRALNGGELRGGEFVLYWMHHAMRARENPALDVALTLGDQLRLPVLVYQGLSGRHPYNSDRHHYFVLQGARDVARDLDESGVRYVFHLPENTRTTSPLPPLARQAAAVILEEMPVRPFTSWHPRLAGTLACPVWSVDTRCLLPMQRVGEAFGRAFHFRQRVAAEHARRLPLEWPDGTPASLGIARADIAGLSDLSRRDDSDLLRLIAHCDIDHSVWPVFHTPGGSRAGEARWIKFRESGLSDYHRLRNDASVEPPSGVSRLSAYLHYGQVSAFFLAREAGRTGGPGPDKFLDELLIWRELAHNFCFYTGNLESLDALPHWARQTLAAHAEDRRHELFAAETLARGRTGDELWDTAQLSLMRHGELHNNLRMTWAKAIPYWTRNPEAALAALIELNHRYALDGCDPNSYGGLLWALGQFDRPFDPEGEVLGRVRKRFTKDHRQRLDYDAYRRRVSRPVGRERIRIAVIGAGIAGLAAARMLCDAGHRVTVLEKSRGPGGRTATRRQGHTQFDHGAQYFTARSPEFVRRVRSWEQEKIIARWPDRLVILSRSGDREPALVHERWAGCPAMNSLARHLAKDIECHYRTEVAGVEHHGGHWSLAGDPSAQEYDALVVSAPAPQAAALLSSVSQTLAEQASSVQYDPCWAVLVGEPEGEDPGFDAAFVDDETLAWIAADHSKTSRPGPCSWVLHATAKWSADNLTASPTDVAERLSARLRGLTDLRADACSAIAHRWRYARVRNPIKEGPLFDESCTLALCGDWCIGESRIENAWLSGIAAAARLLALLGTRG